MKKLLLVDDDRDFRKILSSALEKTFEVWEADGLSQALKVLDTIPINVICSDFYMRWSKTVALLLIRSGSYIHSFMDR